MNRTEEIKELIKEAQKELEELKNTNNELKETNKTLIQEKETALAEIKKTHVTELIEAKGKGLLERYFEENIKEAISVFLKDARKDIEEARSTANNANLALSGLSKKISTSEANITAIRNLPYIAPELFEQKVECLDKRLTELAAHNKEKFEEKSPWKFMFLFTDAILAITAIVACLTL